MPYRSQLIDGLLAEVLKKIAERIAAWPHSLKPDMAQKLQGLISKGLIDGTSQPILSKWLAQFLNAGPIEVTNTEEDDSPLPFEEPRVQSQAQRPDLWAGGIVGSRLAEPKLSGLALDALPWPDVTPTVLRLTGHQKPKWCKASDVQAKEVGVSVVPASLPMKKEKVEKESTKEKRQETIRASNTKKSKTKKAQQNFDEELEQAKSAILLNNWADAITEPEGWTDINNPSVSARKSAAFFRLNVIPEDEVHGDLISNQKQAILGDRDAQLSLGHRYRQQGPSSENYEKARKMYQAAAQQGLPGAKVALGYLLYSGVLGTPDSQQAQLLFRQAAQSKHGRGYFAHGLCLEFGVGGIPVNLSEAAKSYTAGYLLGDSDCTYQLGECYLYGGGVKRDIAKGEKLLAEAQPQVSIIDWPPPPPLQEASHADMEGMHLLPGDLLEALCKMKKGLLSEAEINALLAALMQCAQSEGTQKGNPSAQYALGMLCKEGIHLAQNQKAAFDWFRKASDQLLVCAQFEFALACKTAEEQQWRNLYGLGLIRAADAGHPRACYLMGLEFEYGYNVNQSMDQAFKYWIKGASNQDSECLLKLGLCLFSGKGVFQNKAEAQKWIAAAAQRGHKHAQLLLATLTPQLASVSAPQNRGVPIAN